MTLLIILIVAIIVLASILNEEEILVLIFPFGLIYLVVSAGVSEYHYLEPEIKKIEIQNFILKDGSQAFILYKVEGDPEEKTKTINLNITEGPDSFLEIKKCKPSKWYFINLAFERQKIYIGREDLKSRI